jgi:SagB-type dehydrogenase family enzyme
MLTVSIDNHLYVCCNRIINKKQRTWQRLNRSEYADPGCVRNLRLCCSDRICYIAGAETHSGVQFTLAAMGCDQQRRQVLIRLIFCATGCSAWSILIGPALCRFGQRAAADAGGPFKETMMKLPVPAKQGALSLEAAIQQRRTVRSFDHRALSLDQLSQLLWAAQGITGPAGFKRAAPSAGALYPMDLLAVAGQDCVSQMAAGIYHYQPEGHGVVQKADQDLRPAVARASLSQMWMARAPLQLVITAEYGRAAVKYGKRAVRYALIEAGHIGQNIFLQAEALGLKAAIVGAFHDEELKRVMALPGSWEPLLVMPVGYAAD